MRLDQYIGALGWVAFAVRFVVLGDFLSFIACMVIPWAAWWEHRLYLLRLRDRA